MSMNACWELAPPDAAAMIEALRGVGYSLPTAVADLLDNSIAVNAKNIWIDFHWEGRASWIRIADDGDGMTETELFNAMRLGALNPLDVRTDSDLGRFGMGLKTASFSQCRRLTVASTKISKLAVRRWDLDYIAKHKDWHLLTSCAPNSHMILEPSLSTNGTVVLWELLDRVPGPYASNSKQGENAFLESIDRVERHLSMVFHRYLEGPVPNLTIHINGSAIRPWDPFLSSHPATTPRGSEPIPTNSGLIQVKGFILPHKDRLKPSEWEAGGGLEGWTAQQGFYVYRNRRMLVAGSWLGLGTGRTWTKEEAHKLARLQLDIQNTADAEWKIDIKKSTAKPPSELRPRLRALAEDVRSEARKVFAHRGKYGASQADPTIKRAWKSVTAGGSVKYQIDRQHPVVKEVLALAGNNTGMIETMLRVIEETVPVQKIWLDTVEQGEVQQGSFEGTPSNEVKKLLSILYHDMCTRIGLGAKQAKAQLAQTEPFNRFPSLVQGLPE